MNSNRMNKKNKNSDFLLQGSILAATSIIVRLIGLIYRIPMTRIIGNEGMGYYEYAFEIYNFCFIISSYGMPMAVSKLVAERCRKKEYKNSFLVFYGAMTIAILLGGLLSISVYFGASFISSALFENPAVSIPLKILAPTILISALLGVFRGFFQGKGTMIPTAFSQLIEQLVNGVVSVVAAYQFTRAHSISPYIAAHGAAGGVFGTSIGALFGFIIIVFIFLINVPIFKRQNRRDTSDKESIFTIFKVLLLTVIPVMLSQILTRTNGLISMTLFNKILSAKGFSETEYNILYGIYGSKYILLTNIVLSITNAITMSFIPSLVRAKNEAEINEKVSLTLKFNLIIAIPSTIGLSILGGPIIRLLFNDTAPIISFTMLIGSVAIIFYTVSIFFNTIIQSIDKMRVPVIISIIAILLDVPLLWALLTYTNLNMYALVIGNIFMPFISLILSGIYIKKRLGIRFHSVKTVIIPTIASLIMGIVVFLSYTSLLYLSKNYVIALMSSILLGSIVFFVLEIGMKGITKKELLLFPMGRTLFKIARLLHLMK